MNIEELENKIKELQEKLEKLKKKENKRWRAEENCPYYFIDADFDESKDYEDFDYSADKRYKYHNYFKTEEEAQTVADNIKTHIKLIELAEELNTEHIDWENCYQEKIYIGYCYGDKSIYQESVKQCKHSNTVYCTNENFKDEAINRIGEERIIKYLKGE